MPPTSSLASASRVAPTLAPAPSPIILPATGFLRQPQVLAFVPISKSTLWRRIKARTFPLPVKLSPGVTVWRVEDIRNWIAQQAGGA